MPRPPVKLCLFLLLILPLSLMAQGQEGHENPSHPANSNRLVEMMSSMGMTKEDLREIREKSGGDMEKMAQLMRQKMEQNRKASPEKSQGQGDLNLKDLMNGKAEETVAKVLQPFSQFSEKRLLKMFQAQERMAKFKGENSSVRKLKFLRDNPKLALFVVRLLKDPRALPKLASILDQRTKLWIFVGVNVVLFIVSFLLRRRHRMKNPTAGILTSLVHSVYRFVFMIGVRFGVFLLFFRTEFTPFWSVTKETFL